MRLLNISERLDPYDPKLNLAEKILHLSRYEYAAKVINKFKKKGITILDAACGQGYGSKILQEKTSGNVIAVDLDLSAVGYSVSRNKKIKFVKANVVSLPLVEKSVDSIVCFETIEHLDAKDGVKMINKFQQILKTGGVLIISSPNATFTNMIKRILPRYNNFFHRHEYQFDEMQKILRKNNFEVIESGGQYLFFPLIYLLSRQLPLFNFIFRPSIFFPINFSRYFFIIAKKIR